MRKVIPILFLVAAACMAMLGCAGPEGDAGTTGPQGQTGTQGQDGQDGRDGTCTRTVHETSSPMTSDSFFLLEIPEITLDDMPLVAVYASAYSGGDQSWFELPYSIREVLPNNQFCWFIEGAVCFEGCKDLWIKVVIVK